MKAILLIESVAQMHPAVNATVKMPNSISTGIFSKRSIVADGDPHALETARRSNPLLKHRGAEIVGDSKIRVAPPQAETSV